MTADRSDAANVLLQGYADRLAGPNPSMPPGSDRGVDLMLPPDAADAADAAGAAGTGPALVAATVARFGTLGLQTRRKMVERLVADDGITYGGAGPDGSAAPWRLDPLPLVLDAAEWARVEAGVAQRTRLLGAVMDDLDGPGRLVAEGILPPLVVAGHAGFLVPAHGVRPPGASLPLTATDLTRDPSGAWVVLADRTQAPAGAGYAMANRRIVARALEPVHRQSNLRRLRGWFDLLQAALHEAAPPEVTDVPRVVLLTAGPGSETSYDQALLAILLGHPLAQSDDLVLRRGRLWLRTTGRLEAVDVVLRRVDAAWTDSLDLRSESRLGVPGLLEAARRGTVGVVNPFRAGVLENPALVPFLPAVARALLDEDLLLPQPTTWWCGDPVSLGHVLAHLEHLVVKPLSRSSQPAQIPGWHLTRTERDSLRDRLRSEPWAWTAQEPVTPATAPVVTPLGIEPRNVVLRTFGVALGDRVHVLPGGLARAASSADAFVVTNHSGATSKDVWVLDPEGATPPRVELDARVRLRPLPTGAALPGLTPRSADNLYWMGRYAERSESVARLLLVADNLVEDHARRPGTPGHGAMRSLLAALTEVTGVRPGFTGPDADVRLADPLPHLARVLLDASTPGTLAHSVHRAVAAASDVRELLSLDTSSVLSRLQRVIDEARAETAELPIQYVTIRALDSTLALAGLSAESLIRDPTWAFLEAGRRIERAQTTLRLLRVTLAVPGTPVGEPLAVEAVLRVGDSLITYRRRMAAGVGSPRPVSAALHLLLVDAGNPRSLAYQLDRLREALTHAPDPRLTDALGAAVAAVRELDIELLTLGDRSGLVTALLGLEEQLRGLSDAIVAIHFQPQAPQSSFAVAELGRGLP